MQLVVGDGPKAEYQVGEDGAEGDDKHAQECCAIYWVKITSAGTQAHQDHY